MSPVTRPGHNLDIPERCRQVGGVLTRIGDKWSVLVIMMLGDGPHRFNELRRSIGSISQRMLTLTLRGLERDGLVVRVVGTGIPPRVDYELSALGYSLRDPVEALGNWAIEHQDGVRQAQAAFDERSRSARGDGAEDGASNTARRP